MTYYPPFPGYPELLTEAFLKLSRERGVHDMSIRRLAVAARAAPGTLTYHYRTKDDVLATCARFLGIWLDFDVEERLAQGGLARLLPCPGAVDDRDEQEYAVRLRAWVQLAAYALSSPPVAIMVTAGEERFARTLARRDAIDGVGDEKWGALLHRAAARLRLSMLPGTDGPGLSRRVVRTSEEIEVDE